MATKKTAHAKDTSLPRDEISQRAFEIYSDRVRHNVPGDEATDWYQAEEQVKANHSNAKHA